ncbi:DUF3300 domain-containing protein [Inquilinus sp. CAU 1745]|uniref:DUF3300 domain-containing protein n=1 Tax=Inquilinus sp. CAU 1745 TaxID=3140369 RepID=UPI00325ADFC3
MRPDRCCIWLTVAALLAMTPAWSSAAHGQTADPAADSALAQDLRTLVAPVAFYPDDLLALILPASTFPAEIVQAARLLDARQSDLTLEPDPAWDPSTIALLNYPDVVTQMNEDLAGTVELGEAVLADPQAVFDTIQTLRQEAFDAGYLETSDTTVVVDQGDTIIVQPADPEVIAVPSYDPAPVIINQYSTAPPVIYGAPQPVYWNPAAPFFTGLFFGSAIGFALDWDDDDIDIDIDRADIDLNDIDIDRNRVERINNSFDGERRDVDNLRGRVGDDGRVSWRAERDRPQLSDAQRRSLDQRAHGLAPVRAVNNQSPIRMERTWDGVGQRADDGRIGNAAPQRQQHIGRPTERREAVQQSARGHQAVDQRRQAPDRRAAAPQRERRADASVHRSMGPMGNPDVGRVAQSHSARGGHAVRGRGRR